MDRSSRNVQIKIGDYVLGKALGIGSFGKVKCMSTTTSCAPGGRLAAEEGLPPALSSATPCAVG